MLKQASGYLASHKITNVETIKAHAEQIPLEDNSMDCIFTFNAIHHFDFLQFIKRCSRVIKKDGRIFIYTRSGGQNASNIWGRYFPFFPERETRLYELDKMKQWIQSVDLLSLETVKKFRYKRKATLRQLVEKVKARHYSTFSLYGENELYETLEIFQENIKEKFPDTNCIEWFDENILLVLKSEAEEDYP